MCSRNVWSGVVLNDRRSGHMLGRRDRTTEVDYSVDGDPEKVTSYTLAMCTIITDLAYCRGRCVIECMRRLGHVSQCLRVCH